MAAESRAARFSCDFSFRWADPAGSGSSLLKLNCDVAFFDPEAEATNDVT